MSFIKQKKREETEFRSVKYKILIFWSCFNELDKKLSELRSKYKKLKDARSNLCELVGIEVENFEEIDSFIKDMKILGCKIAIDDFGTGYSNFKYLMKLNDDYIKIDGSQGYHLGKPKAI